MLPTKTHLPGFTAALFVTPDLEASQMLLSWEMDEQTLVRPSRGILCSPEKEWTPGTTAT